MQLNISGFKNILENNTHFLKFKHWVLFGSDTGHVTLLKNKLIAKYKKIFKANIETYDYSEIKSDTSTNTISMLLNSTNLFGDSNIVVIYNYPDTCTKEWEIILQNSNFSGILIIVANDLKKDGKLRKISENLNHIGVVNCYKQTTQEITNYIANYFNERNAQCDDKLPEILANILPSDHLIINNELEKLILYKINLKNNDILSISIKDIENLILDESEATLDDLCFSFIINNKENTILSLKKALANNMNPVFLLRVIQNYLARAIDLKVKMREMQNKGINVSYGYTLSNIVNGTKPPIWGKTKENMLYILQKINLNRLRKLFYIMLNAEIEYKTSNIRNDELLMSKFIVDCID